jgi:hypothetical protein
MANREKILEAILLAPEELLIELNHFMEVYEDVKDYTLIDAFDDAASLAEEYALVDKKMWNLYKQIYVKIGYCIPVDIIKVVSTGKKYWFKMNGIYYDCICGWEQFIKK